MDVKALKDHFLTAAKDVFGRYRELIPAFFTGYALVRNFYLAERQINAGTARPAGQITPRAAPTARLWSEISAYEKAHPSSAAHRAFRAGCNLRDHIGPVPIL